MKVCFLFISLKLKIILEEDEEEDMSLARYIRVFIMLVSSIFGAKKQNVF